MNNDNNISTTTLNQKPVETRHMVNNMESRSELLEYRNNQHSILLQQRLHLQQQQMQMPNPALQQQYSNSIEYDLQQNQLYKQPLPPFVQLHISQQQMMFQHLQQSQQLLPQQQQEVHNHYNKHLAQHHQLHQLYRMPVKPIHMFPELWHKSTEQLSPQSQQLSPLTQQSHSAQAHSEDIQRRRVTSKNYETLRKKAEHHIKLWRQNLDEEERMLDAKMSNFLLTQPRSYSEGITGNQEWKKQLLLLNQKRQRLQQFEMFHKLEFPVDQRRQQQTPVNPESITSLTPPLTPPSTADCNISVAMSTMIEPKIERKPTVFEFEKPKMTKTKQHETVDFTELADEHIEQHIARVLSEIDFQVNLTPVSLPDVGIEICSNVILQSDEFNNIIRNELQRTHRKTCTGSLTVKAEPGVSSTLHDFYGLSENPISSTTTAPTTTPSSTTPSSTTPSLITMSTVPDHSILASGATTIPSTTRTTLINSNQRCDGSSTKVSSTISKSLPIVSSESKTVEVSSLSPTLSNNQNPHYSSFSKNVSSTKKAVAKYKDHTILKCPSIKKSTSTSTSDLSTLHSVKNITKTNASTGDNARRTKQSRKTMVSPPNSSPKSISIKSSSSRSSRSDSSSSDLISPFKLKKTESNESKKKTKRRSESNTSMGSSSVFKNFTKKDSVNVAIEIISSDELQTYSPTAECKKSTKSSTTERLPEKTKQNVCISLQKKKTKERKTFGDRFNQGYKMVEKLRRNNSKKEKKRREHLRSEELTPRKKTEETRVLNSSPESKSTTNAEPKTAHNNLASTSKHCKSSSTTTSKFPTPSTPTKLYSANNKCSATTNNKNLVMSTSKNTSTSLFLSSTPTKPVDLSIPIFKLGEKKKTPARIHHPVKRRKCVDIDTSINIAKLKEADIVNRQNNIIKAAATTATKKTKAKEKTTVLSTDTATKVRSLPKQGNKDCDPFSGSFMSIFEQFYD